jgi:hypothetical protein
MPHDASEHLAWMLPSTATGERKRVVLLANDHARLQTLTVDGQVDAQVEVTLSELGAIMGVLERLETRLGDPVLRKLAAEQERSAC